MGEKASKGIGPSSLELEKWRILASSDGFRSRFELLHNTSTSSWATVNRRD